MHDTALETGRLFFETYVRRPGELVLDVGAMDLNGSLRSVAPEGIIYTGFDREAGPGVDIVADNLSELGSERFDAVVSTSALEHDGCFWQTVHDMIRVVKPGGYVYLSVPSNGHYHTHPLDCWRFYPDAGVALCAWLGKTFNVELVESFTTRRQRAEWNDTVIVIQRAPFNLMQEDFIVDRLGTPAPTNVRKREFDGVMNPQQYTDDQVLIRYLAKNCEDLLGAWLDEKADRDELKRRTEDFLSTFSVHR